MPLPARPIGPMPPVDLLWRHELQEHNATLLRRMNTLEAKFIDQERRVHVAEEAATTCASMAGELDLIKHGVDQLEAKQQEFMSGIHKRLVDMDKDMGEFRKTQERVQKLMSSYRELDDSIADLSTLGPRVESSEREIQGLKNSVGRKHVHEMEGFDARLETLELQRSREVAHIRTIQEDFMRKCSGDFQALRTEVAKLMATRRTAKIQQPYMQVPRSPDMNPRPANLAAPAHTSANRHTNRTTRKEAILHQKAGTDLPNAQQASREVETQGTTQTSAPTEDIEDLDLDVTFIPSVATTTPSHLSSRKKPKLSHPEVQPTAQPHAHSKTQSKTQSKSLPKNHPKAQTMTQDKSGQHHKVQPPMVSNPAPRLAPSKIVKLAVNVGRKRPGSPISAPRPVKEPHVACISRQHNGRVPKEQAKPRTNQQQQQKQPSQPARRSRRRSANATFYELGWDETQQPQKTAGPVYDSLAKPSKPVKTKPRRLPPVPDEWNR
jgi:hypothetical protein